MFSRFRQVGQKHLPNTILPTPTTPFHPHFKIQQQPQRPFRTSRPNDPRRRRIRATHDFLRRWAPSLLRKTYDFPPIQRMYDQAYFMAFVGPGEKSFKGPATRMLLIERKSSTLKSATAAVKPHALNPKKNMVITPSWAIDTATGTLQPQLRFYRYMLRNNNIMKTDKKFRTTGTFNRLIWSKMVAMGVVKKRIALALRILANILLVWVASNIYQVIRIHNVNKNSADARQSLAAEMSVVGNQGYNQLDLYSPQQLQYLVQNDHIDANSANLYTYERDKLEQEGEKARSGWLYRLLSGEMFFGTKPEDDFLTRHATPGATNPVPTFIQPKPQPLQAHPTPVVPAYQGYYGMQLPVQDQGQNGLMADYRPYVPPHQQQQYSLYTPATTQQFGQYQPQTNTDALFATPIIASPHAGQQNVQNVGGQQNHQNPLLQQHSLYGYQPPLSQQPQYQIQQPLLQTQPFPQQQQQAFPQQQQQAQQQQHQSQSTHIAKPYISPSPLPPTFQPAATPDIYHQAKYADLNATLNNILANPTLPSTPTPQQQDQQRQLMNSNGFQVGIQQPHLQQQQQQQQQQRVKLVDMVEQPMETKLKSLYDTPPAVINPFQSPQSLYTYQTQAQADDAKVKQMVSLENEMGNYQKQVNQQKAQLYQQIQDEKKNAQGIQEGKWEDHYSYNGVKPRQDYSDQIKLGGGNTSGDYKTDTLPVPMPYPPTPQQEQEKRQAQPQVKVYTYQKPGE